MPFDTVLDAQNMNLLSDVGFSNALYYASRVAVGGGHTTGPVCSSWVFMFLSRRAVCFGSVVPDQNCVS